MPRGTYDIPTDVHQTIVTYNVKAMRELIRMLDNEQWTEHEVARYRAIAEYMSIYDVKELFWKSEETQTELNLADEALS